MGGAGLVTGIAGAALATGTAGAGLATGTGAGLATGTTGRATGTGILLTGGATFFTAGAGFWALTAPATNIAAAKNGTKNFVIISFLKNLSKRRYKISLTAIAPQHNFQSILQRFRAD